MTPGHQSFDALAEEVPRSAPRAAIDFADDHHLVDARDHAVALEVVGGQPILGSVRA